MRTIRIVLLTLLILCLPLLTFAQETNGRLTATIGLSNAGFKNPIFGFGGGGSFNFEDKLVLDGSINYLLARKVIGGGSNIAGDLSTRIKFKGMFAGPLLSISHQTTSFYTKTATSLGVEIGKQFSNGMIFSGHFLHDFTSENSINSYGAKVEYYGKGRRKGKRNIIPYIGAKGGFQTFKCFPYNICHSIGTSLSVGIAFK